jgi:hypothetical protein
MRRELLRELCDVEPDTPPVRNHGSAELIVAAADARLERIRGCREEGRGSGVIHQQRRRVTRDAFRLTTCDLGSG